MNLFLLPVILHLCITNHPVVHSSFIVPSTIHRKQHFSTSLSSDSDNKKREKKGYKFGDLTKSIFKKATTGIAEANGKDQYEFGDLSRWVDSKVKEKVNDYTGKENYEFGDLTKKIGKKVASGDYTMDDLFLLCKALVSFGVGFSPVAGLFPVKVLIDLLNFSVMNDVGGKLTGALAMEVDKRMKEAVTGDADYQLGDLTKKKVLEYIGKDEYEFGDITKSILSGDKTLKKKPFLSSTVTTKGEGASDDGGKLDPGIESELAEWDKALDIKGGKDDIVV